MSEESKTYVFGNGSEASALSALIPALSNNANMGPLMASMMNGGFGGSQGAWWIIIFIIALIGRGFGNGQQGSTDAILAALNNDTGRDMLLSAINGNSSALSSLSTTIGCDVNALQTAINSVQYAIQSVGNQVGLSGQQIINSIQSGDSALASQLAQCCCDNRLLTTQQGYESRIATIEQTNTLGSKLDQQTTFLSDKFCDLEKREMQNKIDALREERSTLLSQISNANQTAAIQSYVASVVNPIAIDVAAIKAAQPSTVSVTYPNLTAVPTSQLYGYYSNGSYWG